MDKKIGVYVDENGNYIEDVLESNKHLFDEEYIVSEIPKDFHSPKWDSTNGQWVEGKTDTELLEQAKSDKKKEIFNSCKTDISSGFVASLTDENGVAYEFFYDDTAQTKFNAQTNKLNIYMNQLSLGKITQTDYDAKFPIDWRTKSHGWVSFTDDEFVQLTDDAESHERTLLQKRSQLEGQVDAATTVPDVEAIVW